MVQIVDDALAPFAPEGKMPYVHTADAAIRSITATRRFNGGLMMVYGAIAILIGTFGIHGVTAAMVAQQTREIGIRVALGATPRLIRRQVLAHTATHVLAGLAIGLPVAWWLSRGLTAYLFQVTPSDPTVYPASPHSSASRASQQRSFPRTGPGEPIRSSRFAPDISWRRSIDFNLRRGFL